MNLATGGIAAISIAITIEATNAIAKILNPTIVNEMIDATIALDVTTWTQRAPSPMTRRMIANAITPRKRATRGS
jgi:hypothetical protein